MTYPSVSCYTRRPAKQTDMTHLRAENLNKALAGSDGETVEVLRSVSFSVEGPAVIGLLGPNGVGKSVTLRILAGLLPLDSGEVRVNGRRPADCRIGYVPASSPVFGWRRVIDDIGIGMEQLGVARAERHACVIEFLKQFSIELPLQRRTHSLSTGQRQIVGLARALIGPTPPDIVVLDEPWSALSPTVREELLRTLESVRQRMNVLVVLAAHSVQDAARVCDWIIPLRSRPLKIDQNDLIRVDLPHPRPAAMRDLPEFRELLGRVDAIYRDRVNLPT